MAFELTQIITFLHYHLISFNLHMPLHYHKWKYANWLQWKVTRHFILSIY